jgi:hypothetical protein
MSFSVLPEAKVLATTLTGTLPAASTWKPSRIQLEQTNTQVKAMKNVEFLIFL